MNIKKIIFLLLLLQGAGMALPVMSVAQNVGINSTGAAPDASAMLDVAASGRGMLLPRVSLISNTDVATITSPATSLLVYNTNASMTNGSGTGFYYWNGTVWLPIAMTSNSGGPCQASMITNELDATGVPCTTSACGDAMSILSCTNFCAGSTYNGYSDWRMPTISELYNLVTIAPFSASANNIWSTTTCGVGNAYSTMVLQTGAVPPLSYLTATVRCRCVR